MGKIKDKWSALSMTERADVINKCAKGGLLNIKDIREFYNSFDDGGDKKKKFTPFKDLAYRFASDPTVSSRGHATMEDIIRILSDDSSEEELDDNKMTYIYGNVSGLPPAENSNGKDYSSYLRRTYPIKYRMGKIKEYSDGRLNPYGEYVIDERDRGLVEELAKKGKGLYSNADNEYSYTADTMDPEYQPYRDDIASYHMQFVNTPSGPAISASDLYDFGPDYNSEKYDSEMGGTALSKIEAMAMNLVGNPYILRQDNIPIRFVNTQDSNTEWEDILRADYLKGGIEYGMLSQEDKDKGITLDQKIAEVLGTGYIEPAVVTVEKKADGGKVNKYNKGGDKEIVSGEESVSREQKLLEPVIDKIKSIYQDPAKQGLGTTAFYNKAVDEYNRNRFRPEDLPEGTWISYDENGYQTINREGVEPIIVTPLVHAPMNRESAGRIIDDGFGNKIINPFYSNDSLLKKAESDLKEFASDERLNDIKLNLEPIGSDYAGYYDDGNDIYVSNKYDPEKRSKNDLNRYRKFNAIATHEAGHRFVTSPTDGGDYATLLRYFIPSANPDKLRESMPGYRWVKDNPDEIYSKMLELKSFLGIPEDKVVTVEDLNRYREEYKNNPNYGYGDPIKTGNQLLYDYERSLYKDTLFRYKDEDLLNFLNNSFKNGGRMLKGDEKEQTLSGRNPLKEWKALKRMSFEAIADPEFTRDRTGAGSIEYFNADNTDGITYLNGYHRDHPKPGSDVILYDPETNDEQDVRLDALHLMPKDPIYGALYDLYLNAAKNSDVMYNAEQRYTEDMLKYGIDNIDPFDQYFTNEADGLLRNMFIEGTPEYIASKRYYPDKAQLEEWNKNLMPYINDIRKYLESGIAPEHILQPSVVTANIRAGGGPLGNNSFISELSKMFKTGLDASMKSKVAESTQKSDSTENVPSYEHKKWMDSYSRDEFDDYVNSAARKLKWVLQGFEGWSKEDLDYLYGKLGDTGWDPKAVAYAISGETNFRPYVGNNNSSAIGLAQLTKAQMKTLFGDNWENIYKQYENSTRPIKDVIDDTIKQYKWMHDRITSNTSNMGYGRLKINLLAPNKGLKSIVGNNIYEHSLTRAQKKKLTKGKSTFEDLMKVYDEEFENAFK